MSVLLILHLIVLFNSVPYFAVIDCGGLSDPEEGRVTFNPGVVATIDTGLDAVATYVCNDGYDLVGDELRTCQGNGLWSGAEPTCMCKCLNVFI